MTRRLLLLGLVVVLGAAGWAGVRSTRTGMQRSVTVVRGMPVELLLPEGARASPRPGIVVVHGFAGSRQLMYGIAQSLGRNGYAVALIDLPGHGQNPAPFAMRTGRAAGFDGPLTSVTSWLRVQPGVDGSRLALVGHSMGAGAVLRFASRDADMRATVAISGGLPARGRQSADTPRNLLAIAGAWEFDGVRRACEELVTASYPTADPADLSGDFRLGTARQCVIVSGVEHISVLFSRTVIETMVRWFDQALGFAPVDRPIVTAIPWRPALLIHLAGIGLFFVVVDLLFPRRAAGPPPHAGASSSQGHGLGVAPALILLALPPIIAAVVMRFVPGGWLPLLTADYLAGFYLLVGLAMLAGLSVTGRAPAPDTFTARGLWRAVVVSVVAVAGFAAAAQFTWLNLRLTGHRWWLAAILFLLWLPYFASLEAWLRTRAPSRHGVWALVSAVVTTAALTGAVLVLRAPSFLLLLVPGLVPMFLLHGLYGHWLRQRDTDFWPAAIVGSTLFAWITAAVFPLT